MIYVSEKRKKERDITDRLGLEYLDGLNMSIDVICDRLEVA
jgi:hypothetical protein